MPSFTHATAVANSIMAIISWTIADAYKTSFSPGLWKLYNEPLYIDWKFQVVLQSDCVRVGEGLWRPPLGITPRKMFGQHRVKARVLYARWLIFCGDFLRRCLSWLVYRYIANGRIGLQIINDAFASFCPVSLLDGCILPVDGWKDIGYHI